MDSVEEFVKLLELKRYSNQTINCYKGHLQSAIEYFKPKSFNSLSDSELFSYIYHLSNDKKITASYQRQIIGALKLFFKKIQNRYVPFEQMEQTQKNKVLPIIFSKKQIKHLFENLNNLKHKAILSLIYSSGIRIGELLELKLDDVDTEKMLIHIRGEKGKKNRQTILSHKMQLLLSEYLEGYKPKVYLFEGQKGGKYSSESAGQFFKRALEKANIVKKATLHTLRHSFAVHLLENGISTSLTKKLLGHNNISTTLLYTQIANVSIQNIKSPFDD